MKNKMLALTFILATTTLVHALPQTQQWVKVEPPGGKFSVLMPTKPEEDMELRDSTTGPYTSHLFTSKGGGVVYVVGLHEYAPNVRFEVQVTNKANRDSFLKGVKASVTSEREVALDGHPGIEFVAESEDRVFKSRVYVADNRQYMLATGWVKATPSRPAWLSSSTRLSSKRSHRDPALSHTSDLIRSHASLDKC